MNHYFADIIEKIGDPPLWFDENAVPRYCAFGPDQVADIYADEVVLMRVTCQGCGRPFEVALASNRMGGSSKRLADFIREHEIHYGDPPNMGCCGAGPTMNSEPRVILQYWHRHHAEHTRADGDLRIVSDVAGYFGWRRDPALEVDVTPDWVSPS